MIYSPEDSYLHFISIFVLAYVLPRSLEKTSEHGRPLIKGRQIVPHSAFHTVGQKFGSGRGSWHSYFPSFGSPPFNTHLYIAHMHIHSQTMLMGKPGEVKCGSIYRKRCSYPEIGPLQNFQLCPRPPSPSSLTRLTQDTRSWVPPSQQIPKPMEAATCLAVPAKQLRQKSHTFQRP